MTLEVRTVIMLRDRIDALKLEQPLTRAGQDSQHATIADLEAQIVLVRRGSWPRSADAHLGAAERERERIFSTGMAQLQREQAAS